MKQLISFLVVFSLWTGLLAPLSLAQNSNTNSVFIVAQNRPDEPEKEKKGLQFRVREGKSEAPARSSSTPVKAEKLSAADTDSILKRLAPLPADEKTEFKPSPESLPPPKTGSVVNAKFPADENLPPPDTQSSKTLEVIRYSPSGSVGVTPEITVTFSQPMVAVTSQTETSENVPVKITPEIKGRWRWLGTRVLLFDAEKRLPMATKFTATIPAGTRSATGGTLQKDVSWTFSTTPPKVEAFSAGGQTVKGDEHLFAAFDQEINPADVLAKITATANGRKIPLRLLTETEMAKELDEIKKNNPELLKRFIGFRAVELFPTGAAVNITFEKGLPSAEGSLTTTEAKSFSFKTFGPPKFIEARCGGEKNLTDCSTYGNFAFDFNNPLDATTIDKSNIRIDPKNEIEITTFRSQISVRGSFKPRTTYTVTISGKIRDESGQTLGQDVSAKFTMGAADQDLRSQHYKDFITLDPNAKPAFSVFSTNYANLKVRIYSVTPENFPAFLAYKDDEKVIYPTFGKLVFNQLVKVKNKPDESVETLIDLAPALKNGVGHAVLIVEPPGAPKPDQEHVVKWLQATEIGLDAFADREQLSVYTSRLKDGKPLGNVQLLLSNGAAAVSQLNGMATVKLLPKKDKRAVNLIARRGNDSAILTPGEYYQDDDSDYGNGWFASPAKDNLRWFVFDDRKMYRPGETVSIKGYLRKVTGGKMADIGELADAASGISYILKDAQDVEIAKGTAGLNAFGAFDLQIKLPANVNLGYQSLQLIAASKLGENEFTHNFQAQEFRRPEFEVSASVESAAPFYLGDSATILTEAKYFSGGGLADADADWDLSAAPTNYTPPNRDDFTFGKFTPWWGDRYGRDWELNSSQDFKGKTDIEGKHRIALDFLKADPARAYKIEARANIQDVNRQTFSSQTSLLVHPARLYVGLRTPKTFVQAGEKFRVETITTDIDGKAAPNAPVTVTAELKDWQQEKGEWKEVVVDTQKCAVKSAADIVSCEFAAKQGGTYTITARVLDDRERPNESELTVWVAGGNREKSESVEEDSVDLIPDKKLYAPGETAGILLNAPFFPAEGVMTLERGGIVKTERFSLDKSSTVLKIPLEEAFLPNVHVQVTLVGATKAEIYGDERDKQIPQSPAYATGELNLEISTASRKLSVAAEPVDKILSPGGQTRVNLAVTDNQGRAVADSEIALVAVDESVLALTGYSIDNPLDVFYQQFQAETSRVHSREDIILSGVGYGSASGMGMGPGEAYSDVSTVVTTAGSSNTANATANAAPKPMATPAAEPSDKQRLNNIGRLDESPQNESLEMMQLRRNFAALAIFAPSVKTDTNGKATVELKLPDNLTRYRITAVAVTKAKQFGLGESNVTARQPLMIRPSAPRFMNFDDKAELPVVVQNQTDQPMTVDVAIRASNATLTDGGGRKVTVPANDRTEIRFPVTAENAGIARFQIGASAGKNADAAEIEFPVYTPATSEAFATYGTTEQNGAIVQPVSAPKDVFPQFGGLEITTSSTQLQELTDAFIYLQNYPFECSEQVASRILSVAALRDVLTAFQAKDLPAKAEIEAKMKSDIEKLQKLQHADGGFSFWRSDDESFPFVTVHVAHALARAQAKGYAVPKQMTDKSIVYLTAIDAKLPKTYSQESRQAITAYSLYVRNLLGDAPALPQARLFLQNNALEKLSPETLGWILSVLAKDPKSAPQVAEIKRYLMNRVTETADKAHFVTNYSDGEYVLLNSSRRADGVILEALLSISDLGLRNSDSTPTAKDNPKSEIPNPQSDDLIPKLVRGLLANRTKGRWSSTQENAFVLLALDKYFETYEKTTPDFVSRVWLGSAYAGEQKFAGRTTDARLTSVPMAYLQTQAGTQNLTLDKQGAGRLYYRIGLKYAPKNLKLAAADYGFEVTRAYEAVDDPKDVKRNADGSWTIKAGARVRVKVQMVNPANRYHVALVDYLPAGFEIINPELKNSSSTGDQPPGFRGFWNWFDHQNLRDNRAEAFSGFLYPGVWEYKYVARATTIGNFAAPPAKAEEMYSPETFGRSGTDFVTVE